MPSPHITLREFKYPEDYESVIALWSQAGSGIHLGRSDSFEEIAKKTTRDPDLFLLAEDEGCLVGAVMGGFDGRRGMMYHLAVDAAYRRKGVATLLVDELEYRLRVKGCIKYYLLVVPDNQDAIQFYESRGWERMPLLIYGKEIQ